MSRFNPNCCRIVALPVVCALTCVAARGQTAAPQPLAVERRTTKQARETRERYVLLTDGKLIPGIVTETESECRIEQRVGTMHFPKTEWRSSFDSVPRSVRIPELSPASRRRFRRANEA